MASPPYMLYQGLPFLSDNLVYHSQAFARADDRSNNCSIDPGLQWVTERYLEDSLEKTYFHTDVHTLPMNSTFMATDEISAVPQPFQPRFSSPMSSIELASSSESMRSPPADSEPTPSTPTDTSSHHHVAPYEHWGTHDPRFMGMRDPLLSRSSADNYVNPTDVNSSEQAEYNDSEINVDFACLSQRGYSHESYTSQCELEPTENTISLDSGFRRMTSPEEMQPHVEDEISASSQYPPPPHTSSEDGIEDDAKPTPLVIRKRKEAGDDDYKPTKTNTRTTARRGQQARQVAVASNQPSADSPAAKRAKTSHVNSSSRGTGLQQTPKALPPSTSGATAAFTCTECQHLPFKDQDTLDHHIKKTHTRPFTCVFHFAGCDSTFASKNEWKRHVSSQHLLLYYWLCQESSCGKNVNHANSGSSQTTSSKGTPPRGRPRTSSSSSSTAVANSPAGTTPSLPNGVIFNRKDLYTQHLRRMHMPPQVKKTLKQAASKKSGSGSSAAAAQNAAAAPPSAVEWEERMRACQKRACKQRCDLPDAMLCPVVGCAAEFRGPEAWDQRMEHVARHLEKAAAAREPPVVFGGPGDPSLVRWASSDQVAIIKRAAAGDGTREWVLNTPLKRGAGGGPGGTVVVASSAAAAAAATTATAAASDDERDVTVKSEIVVTEPGVTFENGSEDDEDMDAEGEDDI
ncbi:hypothetical protein B0T22DRAFT_201757 [Podospora appendiculata]|uniref:C2H2-type domain-containing protein n=1 Tax=Podospora appendiculata TaxID=314037 RepID=A0AAE0X4F8_9PEZI|nr:hypothetical protein B0T22DRAFT_201757 [Podospora appendiculata]